MAAIGWLAFIAAIVAVVLTIGPSPAAGCPNCKLSVQGADAASNAAGQTGNMAAGYAYSIYFMLAVPAVLATCLVFFIRRQIRQAAPLGAERTTGSDLS